MSDLIDPRLHRYLAEVDFPVVSDVDSLDFGDGEMQFYVRRTDGVYQVTEVQRGSTRLVWTSSERSAVDRWLVDLLAADWRDRHHLSWPYRPVDVEDGPAAVTVSSPSRGVYALAWSEEERPCHAEGLREYDAVTVAHLLQWSMDDILAALQRRNPEPVYSRVLWSKRPRRTPRRG